MAENQLVEEWLRAARGSVYSPDNAAQFAATMALAEGVKWIGESLAELVEMVKESEERDAQNQAKPREVVEFEIGVKNRKPFTVKADAWNFGNAYDAHAIFMLDGDVVFVMAHQKWDYIRRVGVEVKEGNDG